MENFRDYLSESPEDDFLIDTNNKIRVEEVRELRSNWLQKQGENDLENLHGYQFETDVWEFFLSLKPNYISNIHQKFSLDLSDYNTEESSIGLPLQDAKETDVLAVFDNHVYIIECKSTKSNNKTLEALKPAVKDLKHIAKFKSKRIEDLTDKSFIPVNMLFTNGYNYGDKKSNLIIKDLLKNDIAAFSEKYMEYIEAVLEKSESPEFAYKQLLGFFRFDKPDFAKKDESGEPIKTSIKAFTSFSDADEKKRVFTFSISPSQMLDISTVSHHGARLIYDTKQNNQKYYQRLLQKGRVKKIGEFLETNNQSFPNNILVSYRGKEPLEFIPDTDKNSSDEMIGNKPGTLKFLSCPGTFHVIDGQHRLFGYTGLEKDSPLRENHRLIVTAYEDLTVEQEAQLFLDVNTEAKSVSASLIMEIEWGGQQVTKKNLANGIIFSLRDDDSSELFGEILQAEENGLRLNPKNMQSSILKMKILEREEFNKINFKKSNNNWLSLEKSVFDLYEHLNDLFKTLNDKSPLLWKRKDGLLKDIIIGAILIIFDRVTLAVIKDHPPLGRKKITKLSKKYIETLAEGLNSCSAKELSEKVLNLDFYGVRGASASRRVAAYLIYQFLREQDKTLEYPEDAKEIKYLLDPTLSPREAENRDKWLSKLDDKILLKSGKIPKQRENQSRYQRGLAYHNLIKSILERVFSMEEHYGADCWEVLIMPGFFRNSEDNAFFKYREMWTEQQMQHGQRSYKSPWPLIEGRSLQKLISTPAAHHRIKPLDRKEERTDTVLNYIWNNLMIFPKDFDEEIPLNRPENGDKLWKTGSEYIFLFYEYRGASDGSLNDAHMVDQDTQFLKEKDPLFDHYEKEFGKLVDKLAEELELKRKHLEEFEAIHVVYDEDL
ncbi:DGQHR domain-containing protein [Gammaproteobacteria bacterium]|nr:DGQHR domain-containing protein [Gammaproteobacteria bacterium]|tara:strand:- start:1949 stop:4606 length:2658 start_codon:yes stop_codon:yes gene_type:complete